MRSRLWAKQRSNSERIYKSVSVVLVRADRFSIVETFHATIVLNISIFVGEKNVMKSLNTHLP